MSDPETIQRYLAALEDALVSEFRGYQTLVALTQEERQALMVNNTQALQEVLSKKEALLGDLERWESARQAALKNWSEVAGVTAQTLSDTLNYVEETPRLRLKRLRDGILALAGQLRELTQGNRALANSALEGVEAVHNFLISLSQTTVAYQRPGTAANASPSTALAVEQLV